MSNNGNAKDLDSSRAEALQALLSSLGYTTGDPSSPDPKSSPEQLRTLSEKVDEILGNGGGHGVVQGPEPGQFLIDEGLPIVDVTEPVSQDLNTDAVPAIAPEPDLVPMSLLPPDERERRRRERDRILDLLEEEECLQQLREERDAEQERREAIRKRKESAKAELEQLKAVKEMHKKMGKALVRDSRREQSSERNRPEENVPPKSQPSSQTTRKTVSFADVPEVDEKERQTSSRRIEWGDVAAGRLRASSRVPLVSTAEAEKYPMKMHVVERFPVATPIPTSLSGVDSDDEPASSSGRRSPQITNDTSDEDDRSSSSNAGSSDQESLEEEFDYNSAQHHREIALEYYRKRHAIGAETAKTMATHALDDYEPDEIAQLNGQSPLSRFRADRMAAAYDKSHSPASASIGPSVIPASRQKPLRNSVRLGKLERDQLVGGESGESGSEDEAVREILQMLRTGGIQNAGPDFDPSSLARAPPPPSIDVVESPSVEPPTPAPNPKPSKFKLLRGGGTTGTSSIQDHDSVVDGDKARPQPAVSSVVERKAPRSIPSQQFLLNPSARRSAVKAPEPAFSMVVDSPSFPMPTSFPCASNVVISPSSPALSNIVESPSFPRNQPDVIGSDGRPQRPPSVTTSSMKDGSQASSQGSPSLAKPGRPVSRFMKDRR